jgi:hypothetical protein
MNWLLTTGLCVLLIEIVVRLPLGAVLSRINLVSRKALHTLSARSISDHWKEKVLLAYAGVLFVSTMKLAGYLLAVGSVALFLIFVAERLGATVQDFLTSWVGIVFSLVVATLHVMARKLYA